MQSDGVMYAKAGEPTEHIEFKKATGWKNMWIQDGWK